MATYGDPQDSAFAGLNTIPPTPPGICPTCGTCPTCGRPHAGWGYGYPWWQVPNTAAPVPPMTTQFYCDATSARGL